jgi:heme/copper-type cytochrome/quinol oxidase subunit 1
VTNDFEQEIPERAALRRWLLLAIGALMLAGLLALALVVARAPGLSELVTDPGFFRRCLVVHVDLSLLVWLYAFVAAMSFLLPRSGRSASSSRASVFIAAAGVAMMVLAAGARGAQPVLANYVPVIDHWLFLSGLAVFAVGVVAAGLDRRLLPAEPGPAVPALVPAAAVPGLRATLVAVLWAVLCFAGSWLSLPSGLEPKVRYELAHWAGGHVLQLASTLAMVSAWLILLSGALGRCPLSRTGASFGFAALLVPWASAPALAWAPQQVAARETFTQLMRWAIFPAVAFFLAACVRALVNAVREGRLSRRELLEPRVTGFIASALLTVTGWVLGAMIRGSTTTIPAHYHAAIGAVTVAFMTLTPLLLGLAGLPVSGARSRLAIKIQPLLFGVGQCVFAIGFALAGSFGMARKLYGREQLERSWGETLGLGIMALGGVTAVAAGVLFLSVVVSSCLRRANNSSEAWALASPTPGGSHG